MICNSCRKKIDNDTLLCPHCGAQVNQKNVEYRLNPEAETKATAKAVGNRTAGSAVSGYGTSSAQSAVPNFYNKTLFIIIKIVLVVVFILSFASINTAFLAIIAAAIWGTLKYIEFKNAAAEHRTPTKKDMYMNLINKEIIAFERNGARAMAKGETAWKIIHTAIFAFIFLVFSSAEYYSALLIPFICIFGLFYEHCILSDTTAHFLYKKTKKLMPAQVSWEVNRRLIPAETRNPLVTALVCVALFVVAAIGFVNLNLKPTYTIEKTENGYFLTEFSPGLLEMEHIVIPETIDGKTIVGIGEAVFEYNSYMKDIDIPEGVKYIGVSAFEYCESLTEIRIPIGVTVIPDSCFSDCNSLEKIEIPQGVTVIGDYAFCDCDSLKTVILPDSIEKIGDNAFGTCISLTEINIPENAEVHPQAFEDTPDRSGGPTGEPPVTSRL